MKRISSRALCSLIAVSAATLGGTPSWAQADDADASGGDIIVTAQRMEQRLQDVPISITVFSQDTLTNNNVQSAKDLALYTPGLSTNDRYGADNTTFAIRGFQQDQRTNPTVGTYFADVVAPRGSGAVQGGDGAGPGALFDLENVQVLKGPQGTLFGRNTTGGAVLLVPKKPTDQLEGYVEGSVGDYDFWRLQGVINLPLGDSVRLRFGADRSTRDGYMRNIGLLGDGFFGDRGRGDVDYTALRASAVIDVTPELENYTVGTYSKSRSNGVTAKLLKCYPATTVQGIPFGASACAQIAREAQYDFWTVSNPLPDSRSTVEQWQVINTTTWRASETLQVKAILAYAELRGDTRLDLTGNYHVFGVPQGQETQRNQVNTLALSFSGPVTGPTNAESTKVAELQLQGTPNDRLTWQAGVYGELSDPLGRSGYTVASSTPCSDLVNLVCQPGTTNVSLGRGSVLVAETKFRDYAVYGQASYELTDSLKLTAGIRYTWDEMSTRVQIQNVVFGATSAATTINCANQSASGFGQSYPLSRSSDVCVQNLTKKTSAPTWLVNLDYKPWDDALLYAKWSRGYRMGGITVAGPDGVQDYEAEKVDVYEVGAKLGWRGAVPGHFNIAGFYNDFRNQQLLYGIACVSSAPNYRGPCTSNTTVINGGKSRIYGFEAELGLTPVDGLKFNVAYAYLNSKLQTITIPTLPASAPYNFLAPPVAGDVIPNNQPHKLTVFGDYALPLPEDIGRVSVGATYVYTAKFRSVVDRFAGSGNGFLPGTHIVNLNLSWDAVGGSPLDLGLFVTNLTNEQRLVSAVDNQPNGFASYYIAEPRMFGARARVNF